ncbi:MAG: Glutaminase 2 [bacterium]|nr:Glutaminase 2 [bacterium]
MIANSNLVRIQAVLNEALALARTNHDGQLASYIPELAAVPPELTSAAIMLCNGERLVAGDFARHRFTLQSVAKVILLAGFLEEMGEQKVFSWMNAEPSGLPFSSATQLDIFGPIPANPLINAGAILLCSRLAGNQSARLAWLERWGERLLGSPLTANQRVFRSELGTGDRNRALAYLMKSNGVIHGEIETILATYFYLCSLEADITQAAHLGMLLANSGKTADGQSILSERHAATVVSVMATSGLYDESGIHLVRTGLPAKSGVSGLIVAVATGCGGIAVSSPRVNHKGGSVRGHIMLEHLSRELGWHFAFQQQRKEWCHAS